MHFCEPFHDLNNVNHLSQKVYFGGHINCTYSLSRLNEQAYYFNLSLRLKKLNFYITTYLAATFTTKFL